MIRFSQLLIAVCACFSGASLAQHDGDIGLIIDAQKLSSVVITGGEYSENEQIFTASFGDSGFDYFTQKLNLFLLILRVFGEKRVKKKEGRDLGDE